MKLLRRLSWVRGTCTTISILGVLLAQEAHAQSLQGNPITASFSSGCYPGQEVIVRDGFDRLYVTVSTGTNYLDLEARIYYSDDLGHTWNLLPGFVMTAVVVCRSPDLTVDSRNRLHVVWHEAGWGGGDSHFRHRAYDRTLGWLPIERMSTVALTGGRQVSIAVDSQDNLHAVWQDGGGTNFYSTRAATGGPWSSELNIGFLGPQSHLAIDHADDVHVVGGYGGPSGIAYTSRIGDVWGPVERVSSNFLDRHMDMAFDSSNGVQLTWSDTLRLFYRARQPGPAGTWGSTTELTLPHGHAAGGAGASMGMDVDDNLYVMTSCCFGTLRFFRKAAGSSVFDPAKILTDPDVAHEQPIVRYSVWPLSNRIQSEADLHFVWRTNGILHFGGLEAVLPAAGSLALPLRRSKGRMLGRDFEVEVRRQSDGALTGIWRFSGGETIVLAELPPVPAVVLVRLLGDGSSATVLAGRSSP